ncbi:CesT family type III secretion system chaperone [Achromobacter veterisilvae]|uniref:CesT family type III secretion system chaperone n=1 Tax=Achromobacter veterisilvae TaxID=2069367 RepID=A0ABZ2S5Z4_9BURK|nr:MULTISPECIES: CesT family type III secretion system chaperone [Achromobacter]MCW0211145.1 CesT family type III secretion system chaperone [Achromobacter sp.]
MSDPFFARILSELGQTLGIPALAPSEGGLCQLAFDGRHLVQIVEHGARAQILLSCAVGGKMDGAQALLAAQANFMQAGGGVVACAAPDGRMHLQLGVARADCRADNLMAAIDALLNQAEAWEKRCARAEPDVDALRRNPAFMMQSV